MDVLCTADLCPVILNATCVFYEGNTLLYTGITTNDNLQTALQKIDAKFGDAMVGYTFTNGVFQPSAGAPVGLGGNLIANTTIGGNFTLTFTGNLQATKHITTGGTASQFVKGDGTLDSTAYQAAGNYITTLTGDVIAAGPGSAAASLAVVNSNPGTYGSSTRIPIVTVDTKGRVTALTTTAVSVPSGILSFIGDVYGSGVTGSPTTLTLTNVNLNVYTNNTFLKFKVNAKGLVTGATPVTNLDIEGVLGYVPVPETRTLSINGVTHDLQSNIFWTIATGVSGVTASAPLVSSGGAVPNISIPKADAAVDGYLDNVDWNTFNNKQPASHYITDLTGEATGTGPGIATVTLSTPAVTGKVLTGVNITGGTVVATDTILQGFGKLQNQINALIGGSIYQGVWNAATNTPTLTSGVGTDGYYYITNVAGNTNLDGITDWYVGDWAIFHGGTWQQVDNTDAVVSVNGYTGAVSLVSSDIPEGLTNLYFTNTRARQALSLTTTGSSGAATYDNATGIFNIPNYNSNLSGYVPTSRTLTINGTTYDLSANRSWTIAAGVASVTASVPLFSSGGTDPNITIQVANTSQSGYLTNTDWNTFNAKQGALTLTTTGTSGPSTLVGTTLNIPQYQSVLTNPITGTGTVSYVPKFNTTSSIANSNIQDSGTLITLGSNTYVNGSLGIGTTTLTGYNLRIGKTITGVTNVTSVMNDSSVQSDVTSAATYYGTFVSTQATTFTANTINHYYANQGTFGAGSTVSSQYGFRVDASLIGGINNYGFRGQIPSGTNRWNIYMDGTASNYMAGSLGIGTTSLTGYNVRVNKNITGAIVSHGILSEGAVQSDVTDSAYYNRTVGSTVAASFTMLTLHHYNASQGTFGAGSTVNNQYGFRANSSLIGATFNYGFFGDIPSGTNRYNLFMNGTADNYLAGDTSIGTTTLGTATKLTVGGSETAVSAIARGQLINTTLVASANGDNLVALDINPTFTNGAFTGVSQFAIRATGTIRAAVFDSATNLRFSSGTISSYINFALNQTSTEIARFHGTTGNFTLQNGGTFTDAGYRLDVFGLTRFTGTTASDSPTLGSELLTSSNWTSTDWTGNYTVGFTHTTGNTSILSNTLAAVIGTYYKIQITRTGGTIGSITIGFGGETRSISFTRSFEPLATTTGNLTITPTADFDGTIIVSVKTIGIAIPSFTINNSIGANNLSFRATTTGSNTIIGNQAGQRLSSSGAGDDGSNNTFVGANAGKNSTTVRYNTFIGTSAGEFTVTGTDNTAIGYKALQLNTTGIENIAIGVQALFNNTTGNANNSLGKQALFNNTTGFSNIALGKDALFSNTTANNNSAYGNGSLQNNTTGNNNVALGNNAGRRISGGVTANTITNNSIYIGFDTRALADNQSNQIVIGFGTTGLGSNTTVLGNTSTTLTALYGAVITGGTSINASAQLQVDSTTKGFLPPRMTAAQRTAISSPAEGLVVVQSDGTQGLYLYIGSAWHALTML